MKNFKFKVLVVLLGVHILGSGLYAEKSVKIEPGKGSIFIGPMLGVGGYSLDFTIGGMAGYQYYFPKDIQFHDVITHGIRGYGLINYGRGSEDYNYWYSGGYTITQNAAVFLVGADWLVEFNTKSKYVWGLYTGLAFGYIYANASIKDRGYGYLGNPSASATGFGWGWQAGASLTIKEHHRVELSLGYGVSIFNIKYLYRF